MGEMRNTHEILIGKPARKRRLVGPRRRSEDNIKIEHLVAVKSGK
jgi:hypothetical protein